MLSRRTSAMTTFMPAWANAVAMPRPMPLAPPVTNAVLPSTSFTCALPQSPGHEARARRLCGAPALLDCQPVGRHRLVGERSERLVEDLPQLVSMVGVGEDVEVVPPDGAQHLVADLLRVHPGLVQAGEDAHELLVGGCHVGRELPWPDQVALVDLALDEARADHRDADPVRQQAPAQRVRQPVHRELRRRVDARSRARDEGGHGGRVDDVPALPVRLDPGHEGDDAVDDTSEVDAEHPVPVLVRGVGDVVEEVDAGVVAEEMNLPEDPLRLIGGAGERLAIGHVEQDRVHVSVERRRRGLEVVGPYVGDRHAHACRDERLRHAEPDAAPASGDESDSALDVPHARDLIVAAKMTTPRADVVGSLLRPDYLREAREAALAGTLDGGELRAVEDRAVLEAIALQEGAGIDAITDGEYRRHGWIALIPIIDDPLFRAPVSGFEFLEASSGWRDLWKTGEGEPADTSALPPEEPFVTQRARGRP